MIGAPAKCKRISKRPRIEWFWQIPNNISHLQPRGCPVCSIRYYTRDVILVVLVVVIGAPPLLAHPKSISWSAKWGPETWRRYQTPLYRLAIENGAHRRAAENNTSLPRRTGDNGDLSHEGSTF